MPCLALLANADLAIPMRLVRGIEVVRVRCDIALRAELGEWISDTRKGLPHQEWFNGKGPSPLEAAALVRGQLERVTGVIRVLTSVGEAVGRTVVVTSTLEAFEDGESAVVEVRGSFDPFATSGAPVWYSFRPVARR